MQKLLVGSWCSLCGRSGEEANAMRRVKLQSLRHVEAEIWGSASQNLISFNQCLKTASEHVLLLYTTFSLSSTQWRLVQSYIHLYGKLSNTNYLHQYDQDVSTHSHAALHPSDLDLALSNHPISYGSNGHSQRTAQAPSAATYGSSTTSRPSK